MDNGKPQDPRRSGPLHEWKEPETWEEAAELLAAAGVEDVEAALAAAARHAEVLANMAPEDIPAELERLARQKGQVEGMAHLQPHAVRGRDVVSGASTGGAMRKGKRKPGTHPITGEEIPPPSDEELAARVQAFVDKGEGITHARERAGKKYGIPPGTVRSRTEGLVTY